MPIGKVMSVSLQLNTGVPSRFVDVSGDSHRQSTGGGEGGGGEGGGEGGGGEGGGAGPGRCGGGGGLGGAGSS